MLITCRHSKAACIQLWVWNDSKTFRSWEMFYQQKICFRTERVTLIMIVITLIMVPVLVRACLAKTYTHFITCMHARVHTHARTHAHARTHTHARARYQHMHYWWWVGRMRRKKTTDQYTEEKRWVFSVDLKEEREDENIISWILFLTSYHLHRVTSGWTSCTLLRM